MIKHARSVALETIPTRRQGLPLALAAWALMTLMVSGCGQKGALYLPDRATTSARPPSSTGPTSAAPQSKEAAKAASAVN